MKVLQLSSSDGGGAGRAVYRLHTSLQQQGVQSQFLTQKKTSADGSVISSVQKNAALINRLRMSGEFLPNKLYAGRGKKMTTFSAQWLPSRIPHQVASLDPDVINLHWINHGFLQIEGLATLNRPIVWTLHDMWPFTGGCHYSGDCDAYTLTCGHCPALGSARSFDLSRWVWTRKSKAWSDAPLTIVAPSQWLAECARASSLFRDLPIQVIPHGLDLDLYNPVDKQQAREMLDLPIKGKIILFGAINAVRDKRKGFPLLLTALQELNEFVETEHITLVVFGASEPEHPINTGHRTHYLGRIKEDEKLALVYSAADVMVVPSMQEAFGQTAFEAMACATPVVAFNSTGLKDIVIHRKTGYLAKPFSPNDLAKGLAWTIENNSRHAQLCERARATVEKEFSSQQQANRYLSLYQSLIPSPTF